MMKRVLTIAFVIIILTSGIKVSINRHFCGGQLAAVKISLSGEAASCGMEEPKPDCPQIPLLESNCCDNQISFIGPDSNYFPQPGNIPLTSPEKLPVLFYTDSFSGIKGDNSEIFIPVFPPGNTMVAEQALSEICVFRI